MKLLVGICSFFLSATVSGLLMDVMFTFVTYRWLCEAAVGHTYGVEPVLLDLGNWNAQ